MTAVKPKQKPDDKAQSKRFIDKARELETDESNEAFERVVNKIIPAKKRRESDRDSG